MSTPTRLPLPGTPELPLVLSPMVDVTDAAFRSLAREWGADVTCSEMVAAIGLLHDSPTAWRHVQPWGGGVAGARPWPAMADDGGTRPWPAIADESGSSAQQLRPPHARTANGPEERPYGVQFMTGDPDEMAAAVRKVGSRLQLDFVDVNLGCPAPNILKVCAGGFLMRDPVKAGRVVRAAVEAAGEVGIPRVSVKMRLGPSASRLTYLEVARQAEAAGAAWVTLHARTIEQGYSGQAEWSHIARLVESVSIPVVGNGDLRSPADVARMRRETGCAGFFIARAAMRDPTIFRRMRAALEGRDAEATAEPGLAARLGLCLDYIDRLEAIGIRNVGLLRRQASRFAAGHPGARALRERLQGARDGDAIRTVLARVLVTAMSGSQRAWRVAIAQEAA